MATEAENLELRIAVHCVLVKLVGCCGVQTQTGWHTRRHVLMHEHTNTHKLRTYHQKESVSGQPTRPVDSAVLLLASVCPAHLTVQAFCGYW